MSRTAWLAPLVNTRIARGVADAGFVQLAHRRVKQLDQMNVAKVQESTLMKLVRYAQETKFGRDHDFAGRDRGIVRRATDRLIGVGCLYCWWRRCKHLLHRAVLGY